MDWNEPALLKLSRAMSHMYAWELEDDPDRKVAVGRLLRAELRGVIGVMLKAERETARRSEP